MYEAEILSGRVAHPARMRLARLILKASDFMDCVLSDASESLNVINYNNKIDINLLFKSAAIDSSHGHHSRDTSFGAALASAVNGTCLAFPLAHAGSSLSWNQRGSSLKYVVSATRKTATNDVSLIRFTSGTGAYSPSDCTHPGGT